MANYSVDTLNNIKIANSIKGYQLIQDELRMVEERLVSAQPGHHELLNNAAEHLFRAGGKRMRAAVSLLASGTFGADLNRSISLATGIEMLHTATLVHDDMIDHSLIRRGKPTLNAGPHANFSILIGDYFFSKAASIIASLKNVDIMEQFAHTLMTIINGEVTQHFTRWRIDHQEYIERIYAKTGAMFVLASKAGATLGEATPDEQLALERFGYTTGIAFQIIDDILDFTSDASELGKPVGHDLREGLFTLPVLLYSEQFPNDPDYLALLENQDGNSPSATRLIEKIRHSKAIDAALAEARDLANQGKQMLKNVPYSGYVDALASVADTVINRKV